MPKPILHIVPTILLLAGAGISLPAQSDSLLVTKNFQFAEGVYLSYESFRSNQPDLGWDSLDVTLVLNPQTHEARVATVALEKKDGQTDTLELETFWGICVNGIPYIRLEGLPESRELTTFAALRLRGKICYFSYRDIEERDVEVSAYNPRTGRPFRTATVRREFEVTREFMLDFQTGETRMFTTENFLEWITDDPGLQESVRELSPDDQEEKLFRCLLIYVDRNPVYLDSVTSDR